jgi:hypothetical protein
MGIKKRDCQDRDYVGDTERQTKGVEKGIRAEEGAG